MGFLFIALLLSEYISKYAKVAAELDQMVTRMIFESYGVERYHDAYTDATTYLLRLLKNRAPQQSEPTLGFITHTDKSFTTILHQNQVNALEVETRDGNRINVDFSSPSSFVVIAGDALMVSLRNILYATCNLTLPTDYHCSFWCVN